MKYFRVLGDNEELPDRWFLDEPLGPEGVAIDARDFMKGEPYHGIRPLDIGIIEPGIRAAFLLSSFDMPVVSADVAAAIELIDSDSIQRFPIRIDGSIIGYEILNATRTIKCLDEDRAEFDKWTPTSMRPDKAGQYRSIWTLVIDPAKVNGCHIFRLWGSRIVLIVSERIVEALSPISPLGVVFKEVIS